MTRRRNGHAYQLDKSWRRIHDETLRVRELRKWVVQQLRRDGYTFEVIAQILGISRQRADQIDKRVFRDRNSPEDRKSASRNRHGRRLKAVTQKEFEDRVATINQYYEDRIQLALSGRLRSQPRGERRDTGSNSLFETLQPVIRSYRGMPFSFSMLIRDYPHLADAAYLPQMLYRLRRRGSLHTLGKVRVGKQSVPEILVREAPADEYASKAIEEITRRWSRSLLQVERYYRPTRPAIAINDIRRHLAERLLKSGYSRLDIGNLWSAKTRIRIGRLCPR